MHGSLPPPWIRTATRAVAVVVGLGVASVAIWGSSVHAHADLSPVATLPAWWVGCIPFALLLGALAVLPLVRPVEVWWESNASKLAFSGLMGLVTLLWMRGQMGPEAALTAAAHGLAEFVPFIVLLLALYVIAGGVQLEGTLPGSTRVNLLILGSGAVLANLLGTTGASMLLIRPLLRANAPRKHQVHTVVFFIFIVSNVGGCLLPIGDPPLFLGFLRGVPFFWTLGLWKEWACAVALLLVGYAILDGQMLRKDPQAREALAAAGPASPRVKGWPSVLLMLLAVTAVATVQPGRSVPLIGWIPPMYGREVILLLLAAASVGVAPWSQRRAQGFTLMPMGEVAAVFAGIFLAMQVPLAVLAAKGASLGLDTPMRLFWWTGGLSSVLDNAPTYLVFMEVARGVTEQAAAPGAERLMDGSFIRDDLLTGVALGAVFMGAMTYIGNGPNLMVRAIATSSGVRMPGFGGYMLWSIGLLLPVLLLVSVLFLT